MSFPSRNSHPHPPSQDAVSSITSPTSTSTSASSSQQRKAARGTQSRWALSQNQTSRQGSLTINTGLESPSASSSQSPARAGVLSPTAAASTVTGIGIGISIGNTAALRDDNTRHSPSRQSSASSVSSTSLFSPTGSAQQQQPSSRSSPYLTSSTALSSSGLGGGSVRGPSRFGRDQARDLASPSSTTAPPPQQPPTTTSTASSSSTTTTTSIATTPQSANASTKQIASVVKSQLNILLTQLSSLRDDKDRTKWEAQADKVQKVSQAVYTYIQVTQNRVLTKALRPTAGGCTRHGGLISLLSAAIDEQCLANVPKCPAHRVRWRQLSAARR